MPPEAQTTRQSKRASTGFGINAAGATPTITHCDIFANSAGDSLPADHADNMSVDPRFCGLSYGDLTFCGNSPCLPGNNTWNELVGALGQGCADCESATKQTTWGRVKALFR